LLRLEAGDPGQGIIDEGKNAARQIPVNILALVLNDAAVALFAFKEFFLSPRAVGDIFQ